MEYNAIQSIFISAFYLKFRDHHRSENEKNIKVRDREKQYLVDISKLALMNPQ